MPKISYPEWAEGVVWVALTPQLPAFPRTTLTFYGRDKRGACNVACTARQLPHSHYRNIPLPAGGWQTVVNLARQARLEELPVDEPKTGWVTLDGTDIAVVIDLPGLAVERQRHQPELRYARLVNRLIDVCPVFEAYPEVKQSVYCFEREDNRAGS